jgi:hypothetical protein
VNEKESMQLLVQGIARRAAERQSEYLESIFEQAPAAIVIVRARAHRRARTSRWPRRGDVDRTNRSAARCSRRFPAHHSADVRPRRVGQCQVGKGIPFRTSKPPTESTQRTELHLRRFATSGQVGVLVIGSISPTARARERWTGCVRSRAANRAKDEFLAMLEHELRNPLSPISTALQLMRLRGAGGRELDVLERQVFHLTRLVDDLLDVSRATRGKIELHRRDLELADIVSEAIEVSSPLLEQRRHVVEIDVPREGLGVSADPERIVQAISNLLTNAAKYSDPESRITIRGTRTDGKVRLAVRDRGTGIAPEMLGRVFDLFVQQPQTLDRAGGGLGLGLRSSAASSSCTAARCRQRVKASAVAASSRSSCPRSRTR